MRIYCTVPVTFKHTEKKTRLMFGTSRTGIVKQELWVYRKLDWNRSQNAREGNIFYIIRENIKLFVRVIIRVTYCHNRDFAQEVLEATFCPTLPRLPGAHQRILERWQGSVLLPSHLHCYELGLGLEVSLGVISWQLCKWAKRESAHSRNGLQRPEPETFPTRTKPEFSD